MIAANSRPVNDPALIALLLSAATGGALAGRAVVAFDARLSGVVDAIPHGTWTAAPAGMALVGLALADAPRGPGFAGALALAVAAFAVAFLRGAVHIAGADLRARQIDGQSFERTVRLGRSRSDRHGERKSVRRRARREAAGR